jgi:hypothetical protein
MLLPTLSGFFAHDGINNTLQLHSTEYDGSPRRFGVATNDDFDYYSSQSNYKYGASYNSPPPLQSSSTIGVNGNYSSPSPPRPGFPQRVLSYEQSAQNLLSKSYSFDDQQLLASPFTQQQQQQQSITTTSTLIPTTFINNSAYEMLSSQPPPQEKTQTTIEEEPENVVDVPTLNEEEDELVDEENVVEEETEVIVVPETNAAIELQEQRPQSEVMMANTMNAATAASAFDMTSPTEENLPTSTFDYLYEFSETRKVLEEFFKCPDDKIKEFEKFSDFNESDDSLVSSSSFFLLSPPSHCMHKSSFFILTEMRVELWKLLIILHSISSFYRERYFSINFLPSFSLSL